MQSSLGNRHLLRLFGGGVLQTKLTINQPGDVYEQEADRVAEQAMRMPEPESAAEMPDLPQANPLHRLQRCSCGGSSSSGGECEECKAKVMRLQRSSTAEASAEAPPIVDEVLRSTGHPLDRSTRDFMEPRFGVDFGDVRVHTGAKAEESAKAVNAVAYTVGKHIAFRSEPDTRREHGRRLLAHELSHVVQQADHLSSPAIQRAPEENNPTQDCKSQTPPLDDWSNDTTLNRIRSEAIGDNRVLIGSGRKGTPVQLIQRALIAWGCSQNRKLLTKFGADGDFGGETKAAVRTFQSDVGIASDGIVGPVTLARLDSFVAFGSIPEFPSADCKVVPPHVPAEVIQSLASLGFAASSQFTAPGATTGESAFSAGIAGIPIFCQVGAKGGGGGKKGGGGAPAGICNSTPQHVASIGNAVFALCEFIDGSRVSAGVIPKAPCHAKEANFVEFRALGMALFADVGSSLPTSGPGSADTDWQHGFIQTVQNLKYTALYQRGWSSSREVSAARRDAAGSSPAPWYANQSIPNFLFNVGNTVRTIQGPIGLGPEFIGTDPVGILDDPRVLFVNTVPINKDPVCPCSFLQSIEAKGELDTWLVVTPNGKGQQESDLAFLKHVETKFDLKADLSTLTVQGTPTMKPENGRGSKSPVLTGTVANDDLKAEKIVSGAACPVTIPSVKCPVESPKCP